MKKTIHGSRSYYKTAHQGSLYKSHPGMKVLFRLSEKAKKILDLGCGEGTRLSLLRKEKAETVGVDINDVAIKIAKKKYPDCKFIKSDLVKLPFNDNVFDLVYSAFVLEHLDEPEKVLLEALRVTKHGGHIVLIAPNYGAPNRASPPFQGSRMKKFIIGIVDDIIPKTKSSNLLNWKKVKPIASVDKYEPDWDTIVEPYLGNLSAFLEDNKLIVKQADSLWTEELPSAGFHQKVFRFLGMRKICPFLYWGPHFLVVAKK